MFAGVGRLLAVLAIASVATEAYAQLIPPSEQPGRERERFTQPPTPRAVSGGPIIRLPSTEAPAGAEAIKLRVREVRITGSTVYGADTFAPLYADLVGREVTLQAVYDLARRITTRYGNDGYVLSRAIVPPQELNPRGAIVRIQVVEGYVDKVVWPAEVAKYRDFFSKYAAKIMADRPANIRTLERYLLLAGDLPGLRFRSSLKASETNPAASTLMVEVTEKPYDLLGRVDNRGSEARGPYQYYGSATVNNVSRIHEAFNITYAGTFQTRELQYLYASYRQVLNSEGLTAFLNGSFGWGKPGPPVAPILDYATRSGIAEAGLSYPVIRSRERNLTLTGLAFASDDQSDIFGDAFTRDRLRGVRARVDADIADPWRGINYVTVTISQGLNGFGAGKSDDPFAPHADGRIDFTKFEGTYSRLQPLVGSLSAFVALYGQYALQPLVSSELCGYGGRYFGRAFDPSQFTGDHCWLALGELRYDLPLVAPYLSQAQLYGFYDHGTVYNIDQFLGTTVSTEGASVGAGVRFGGWQNGVTADLSVAKAVEGPQDDWRFFFIVAARR